MNINELRRIAANAELSLNYVAKDEMLSLVLFQLQNVDSIILKGGTAINRVYLKNKRFSEGIDLDLIFAGTVKQAISKTKRIASSLTEVTVDGPYLMGRTIRYDLYYTNPLRHKDKIRLEFKVISKPLEYTRAVVNFGVVPTQAALLNVYTIDTLLQQKFACLLSRREGKDIFDVYYLLETPHKFTLSRDEKANVLKRLELNEAETRAIANVANHFIPRTLRPSWGMMIMELKEKIMNT